MKIIPDQWVKKALQLCPIQLLQQLKAISRFNSYKVKPEIQ